MLITDDKEKEGHKHKARYLFKDRKKNICKNLKLKKVVRTLIKLKFVKKLYKS